MRYNYLIQNPDIFKAKIDINYLLVFNTKRKDGPILLKDDYRAIFQTLKRRRTLDQLYRLVSISSKGKLKEILDDLIKYGLIIPDINIVKIKVEDKKELDVWINVTGRCNLNCSYCYIKNKNKKVISDKVIINLEKLLLGIILKHNFRKVTIKIAGGEPLLYFKKVKEIVNKLRKIGNKVKGGFYLVIVTNGTIIDENIARFIKNNQIELMLSLDNLNIQHGSNRCYADGSPSSVKVLGNLELLLRYDIKPYISTTITKNNYNDLYELAEYLLKKKLIFGFNFLRGEAMNDKNLHVSNKILIKILKRVISLFKENIPDWDFKDILLDKVKLSGLRHYPCGLNRYFLVINEDGTISNCQMFKDNIISSIGDFKSFDELYTNKQRLQNINIDNLDTCNNCLWRYFCVGGCPFARKNGVSTYCEVYKAIIPELIKLDGQRAIAHNS